MTSYVLEKNDEGYILECNSCQVQTETARFGKDRLCELCATTFISNAYTYPKQYSFVTPIMLAQAIHWLRKELKK